MNAITSFDKRNLQQAESAVIEALNTLSQQTGIKFRFRGGNFSSNLATLKLELSVCSASGETPEEIAFKRNSAIYGIPLERLNREFKVNGEIYKFVGMRECRSKFKFFGISSRTGKRLLFTTQTMTNDSNWLA